MPPKAKKPDANKNQGPFEDESGILKNEASFKFSFTCKQTELENILIMFEWISSTDGAAREKIDTELIECWTQPNPEDPTLLTYEMELPSYRIEDKFVKNLCSDKFYIYFVSAEDQTVKDAIYLNYSPLLTAKGEPKFESYHDKIKIPEIESFSITVTADKELLTPMFRDYLNPLEICIVGAKEMPNNNTSYNRQEPVYVQAKFYDGTVIKTHQLPHGHTCKWMYKQVILVGLMDHIQLQEALKSMPLTFEVHDQDEVSKNQVKDFKNLIDIKYEEPQPPVEVVDPKAKGGKGAAAAKKVEPPKKEEKKEAAAKDAKGKDAKGKKDAKKKKDVKSFEPIKPKDTREFITSNHGIANFNLNDLLNPHVNTLKLRTYIVPVQKYENKDAKNLDLNTTARKALQEAHIGCDYMSNDSYLVVTFNIAHAIRLFKKPVPAQTDAALNVPAQQVNRPKSKQVPAGKADPKKDAQAQVEPPKVVVEEKPIFERAVYVLPYKSPEYTQRLIAIVNAVNLAAFGQPEENHLFITTKALSEDEKKNRDLDIITGLEFIDGEYRVFILEGLADKAMARLEQMFPKVQPNSKDIKILKNPTVKFKDRLFLSFNIDIKKVKLRENLSKLLNKADIYLRSKVPEHIYDILVSLNELRKCDTLKAVVSSNLFPNVDNIIAMERKYGDALTEEDISGVEGPPKKVISRIPNKLQDAQSDLAVSVIASTTTHGPGIANSKRITPRSSPGLTPGQGPDKIVGVTINESSSLNPNSLSKKLLTQVDNHKNDKYSLHMKHLYPRQEGEEVYTRAGIKMNVYEKQRAELREIVRNDPNHFYTYSADYLSLSIDPYAPDEVKRMEDKAGKTMWKTQNGFQTILKKDKSEYNVHPKKPHPSKIDELTTHPWHADKLEETKKLTNTRGEAVRGGKDFRLRVAGNTFFSAPEILEAEMITAVEKERQLKEAKLKAEEAWKQKVIVDNTYFYTSLCQNRNSQLDKIQDIREGEAVKKGLLMKDTRLKNTTLGTTKSIQQNPTSIYLNENWEESANKNFFERQLDMNKTVSAYDFKRNIKQANQYDMVYKPMKEIFH